MSEIFSLVLSEAASLVVRRAVDVVFGICSWVYHHYLGLYLRGGRRGGHRGRRGRRSGQVVKACDRDAEACIVPIDDVEPAGGIAEAVLDVEDEVA